MSIVTKTGDKGETGLLSGERVSKNDPRVETYGTLDELVSHLGFCRGFPITEETEKILKKTQKDLFRLGAELASTQLPSQWKVLPIGSAEVKWLEQRIQEREPKLNLPKSFMLPGGSLHAGALDLARAVSRRLERQMVALNLSGHFKNKEALVYMNRLSDLLFVLARVEHLASGKDHEPV